VGADKSATPRHVVMSWAKRLQRVFGIEIKTCARCHGRMKVIASIEDAAVIARILARLDRSFGTRPELAPLAARATATADRAAVTPQRKRVSAIRCV